MARSAPEVSFSVGSIDYGTIDVGGSSTWQQYSIFLHGNSTSWAEAINMSISFKESTNAAEAETESWVRVSTVSEDTHIRSVGHNKECYVGSVIAAAASAVVRTLISVPAAATTAGRVAFLLHHRYQYTG
jgi:hypothetical protein